MVDTMKAKLSNKLVIVSVALLLAIHVLLVFRVFPVSVFLRGEIPVKGDVSRYYATTYGVSKVGGMFGYDPFFMAGYPVGLWNSMGRKGFDILHLIIPHVPLPSLFYLALVIGSLFSPLLAWLALQRVCSNLKSRAVLMGLCLAYWHLEPRVEYFWNFGNIPYPATACLFPLIIVKVYDVVMGRRVVLSAILLGVLVAVVFYSSSMLILPTAACIGVALMCQAPRMRQSLKPWWAFFGAATLSVALTLPWLILLVQSRADDYQVLLYPGFTATVKHLLMDVFSDRVYLHHFDRTFLFHVAIVFGFAGAWWSLRETGKWSIAVCCALSAAVCLGMAYSFSYIRGLEQFQAYRLLTPAIILLLGPTTLFLELVWTEVMKMTFRGRAVILALALCTAPAFTAYLLDLARTRGECGVSASQRAILHDLGSKSIQGRILCDDVHLAHLIPSFCDLPVLGGLNAEAYVKHGFSGIDYKGKLFERSVTQWSGESLRAYFDAYAVGGALFSRGEWIAFAEGTPTLFKFEGEMEGHRLYRVVDAKPSLVLMGMADVTADYGVISVKKVKSKELVLKLHYARWLKAGNGVSLLPERVLDDPVPFIRASVPPGVMDFKIEKTADLLW